MKSRSRRTENRGRSRFPSSENFCRSVENTIKELMKNKLLEFGNMPRSYHVPLGNEGIVKPLIGNAGNRTACRITMDPAASRALKFSSSDGVSGPGCNSAILYRHRVDTQVTIHGNTIVVIMPYNGNTLYFEGKWAMDANGIRVIQVDGTAYQENAFSYVLIKAGHSLLNLLSSILMNRNGKPEFPHDYALLTCGGALGIAARPSQVMWGCAAPGHCLLVYLRDGARVDFNIPEGNRSAYEISLGVDDGSGYYVVAGGRRVFPFNPARGQGNSTRVHYGNSRCPGAEAEGQYAAGSGSPDTFLNNTRCLGSSGSFSAGFDSANDEAGAAPVEAANLFAAAPEVLCIVTWCVGMAYKTGIGPKVVKLLSSCCGYDALRSYRAGAINVGGRFASARGFKRGGSGAGYRELSTPVPACDDDDTVDDAEVASDIAHDNDETTTCENVPLMGVAVDLGADCELNREDGVHEQDADAKKDEQSTSVSVNINIEPANGYGHSASDFNFV